MNSILLRFPNGAAKALTLSYDDAVTEDIRLIAIMQKHGLKGTFNINTSQYISPDFSYPPEKKWGRRMTEAEATALYSQEGVEPALHGYTHSVLSSQPPAQVVYEVMKDRDHLESQFGKIVRGMAYPFGAYNDSVLSCLKSCGIAYCRTTKETHRFDLPADWLCWHPTCHHNDPMLFELTQKFLKEDRSTWLTPRVFYLWGHAYEFEQKENWDRIEKFAAEMGDRDDIWYATNIEIYEYVEAFRQLIFTLDERIVTNPTATAVRFYLKDVLYTIEPGETRRLF
ncbi:MAG: polysaccharide deacetylase [Ruminococcaceae bacterium]|nr:polysaccharide deacetylase [Oscillospiraceae bacterium]